MNKPSEYVTEMFHKLREDISAIKHKLFAEKPTPELSANDSQHRYTIDAVYTNSQSTQEDDKAIRATLNLPPTIRVEAQTEERQKHWRKDRNVLLQGGTIFVGVIVAVIYACQLNQMVKSNKLTQNTLQISQRAYMTIGRKDGKVAEFVMPVDPKYPKAGMVIYFQNGGHLPAKFNWGPLILGIIPPLPGVSLPQPFKHWAPMTRILNRKNGSRSETGTETIGGDSSFVADVAEIPKELIDKFSDRVFMLQGAYEYCDSLGHYSCREFTLYYQTDPYNTFRSPSEIECPELIRVIPNPQPDVDYLPPCELEKR